MFNLVVRSVEEDTRRAGLLCQNQHKSEEDGCLEDGWMADWVRNFEPGKVLQGWWPTVFETEKEATDWAEGMGFEVGSIEPAEYEVFPGGDSGVATEWYARDVRTLRVYGSFPSEEAAVSIGRP